MWVDQQTIDRVFAVESGHRDELVEDPPLLFPTACSISIAYRMHELAPRVATDPCHRRLQSPDPLGSRFREATTAAR